MNRRAFLGATTAVGAAILSGCAATDSSTNEPDPDHSVEVDNNHTDTHTLSVTVTRESGEVVHDETHEVEPGATREIYNLQDAAPDGIESFTIEATMGDQQTSVTIKSSACYGGAIIYITDDGALESTYAIC
ncbi:twin-arginine translocation signal domain-containing protein [Haloarchaeobius sp. TZWSO28]|uniref:twin-arginine translocation signal domain-containing protein n=1 Tax=Haloarchaeobius sp. TZWSO28 TaxID=3446119 RepID=UPI003EB790E5